MRTIPLSFIFLIMISCAPLLTSKVAPPVQVKVMSVGEGWANNSVNAVIFRRNSLTTHGQTQYAAYYDTDQYVVLAKRSHTSDKWETQRTSLQGNASDAHNSISIMTDGEGYLHLAWDHHDNPLRYARSLRPGSLEMEVLETMTQAKEDRISYPEFYRLPDGNLLFFYRYGASGRGDLVINRYNTQSRQWTQLQPNLIDGEGMRNAYWQACVDGQGIIHLSWVWRESPDVASNHDLCYARSSDGGLSWENSKGEPYQLPITAQRAELAFPIPQNSELINQTSMTADSRGNPIIATYWREQGSETPQYRLVYYREGAWHTMTVSSRQTPFSLSGGGTKRIPISRPQVLTQESGTRQSVYLIFRDSERGNKASVATNSNFPLGEWQVQDLNQESLGAWEPSYDTESWKSMQLLHLFVQKVDQLDAEGLAENKPEMVRVLEWKPAIEQP